VGPTCQILETNFENQQMQKLMMHNIKQMIRTFDVQFSTLLLDQRTFSALFIEANLMLLEA